MWLVHHFFWSESFHLISHSASLDFASSHRHVIRSRIFVAIIYIHLPFLFFIFVVVLPDFASQVRRERFDEGTLHWFSFISFFSLCVCHLTRMCVCVHIHYPRDRVYIYIYIKFVHKAAEGWIELLSSCVHAYCSFNFIHIFCIRSFILCPAMMYDLVKDCQQ